MLQTKPQIRPLLLIALGLVYALGMVLLGFFWNREASLPLLLTFALTFGCSLLLYRQAEEKNHLKALLFVGLLVRFSYLFTWPELSDDFYRFFFDGLLVQQGINPYSHLPEEAVVLLPAAQRHGAAQLLQEMNSPQYHSVYPPLQQSLFALGAWLGPQLHTQLLFHKVLLLLAEVLSIRLLLYLLAQPRQALLYALNPLVIVEGVGNLHAEIYIVSCLLLLLLAYAKGHFQVSILACWAAVGLKLLPLIYLPLLFKAKKWPLQLLLSTFIALGLSIPFWLPGAWEASAVASACTKAILNFSPFSTGIYETSDR
ncbi:hypothetical protein A3SI_10464 [Nitritalea halalkaliphila LW7]|uniref:DUF2029 domain-containing protein n=1 Tax=Nitritalea halalkaliphila LW7 TaxID=1189621 RepID=I5C3M7_9BACT|nr:hypothetical protein [Nitritalea halalkaliphila]EIM76429.1 hypothetical protein A3SI_10464 [Nitritalea halalkaliphila LW7]